MKFSELGLHPSVLEAIDAIGFEQATPIQAQAIPHIIEGRDIIGAAQTGTGKTAAFLLPVIHHILTNDWHDHTVALIMVPTRELAIQVDQQIQGLSYFTSVSSVAIYGGGDGDSFSREKTALTEGASFIVATPGRLIMHLNLGYVRLEQLKYLILDEADRMLDMGFMPDITKIISHLPTKRQNLMFSATMPPKIRQLAKQLLHEPAEVSVAISVPAEKIVQVAFVVYETQKIPLIEHVLTSRPFKSVIVFCSTKDSAKALTRVLKKTDLSVDEIHSDLDQKAREEVMNRFRSRKLTILVATDVLSRGIDIEDLELVINFDVPNDSEDYIHRIGRTARAASKGAAFTFISEVDQSNFGQIEQFLGRVIPKAKIPESLGEAPEYNPQRRQPKGGRGRGKRR